MKHPTLLLSVAVLGAVLWPGSLASQPHARCGAQATIDKIREDPVLNSTDVQYTYTIRVVSGEESCLRATPTIAFTARQASPPGETREATETFETQAPAIVTRGGVGSGRMTQQSATKILRAKVTAVTCGPCEPGDEAPPAKSQWSKHGFLALGAAAVVVGGTLGVVQLTRDSFPGTWLGQLQMRNFNTFGVDCQLLPAVTYDLGLTVTRGGDTLTGTCSVVPKEVNPARCFFAVPPQSAPLHGTLTGSDFSVTCGDAGMRAGVLSGVVLTGTRTDQRMQGTARTPLGESGDWELAKQ